MVLELSTGFGLGWPSFQMEFLLQTGLHQEDFLSL
jgi:hypothetical protein